MHAKAQDRRAVRSGGLLALASDPKPQQKGPQNNKTKKTTQPCSHVPETGNGQRDGTCYNQKEEVIKHFLLKCFLDDGALQRKISSENRPCFFFILHAWFLLRIDLGHIYGFLYPVYIYQFIFAPNQFFGKGLELPNWGVVIEKKSGVYAPLSYHAPDTPRYRSLGPSPDARAATEGTTR